jgi:hypothetical protein
VADEVLGVAYVFGFGVAGGSGGGDFRGGWGVGVAQKRFMGCRQPKLAVRY